MMRRTWTVVAAAAILTLMAGPASAAHTYVGTAEATSFELSVAGEGIVVGDTTAGVQSSAGDDALCAEGQQACATAAGEAVFGGTAQATAPGNPGPNSVTAFSTDELPEGLPVTGSFGAAEAEASAAPDESARGDAQAAALSVGSGGDNPFGALTDELSGLLQPGEDSDGPTGTPLDDIIGQLPGGEDNPLSPVLEPLTQGLEDLTGQLSEGGTLVDIALGTSHAESADDEDQVTTAAAVAEGGTVSLIGGLVGVNAGDSRVAVQTDQQEATADASSGPLTVSIGGDQLPAQLRDGLQQLFGQLPDNPLLGVDGDTLTITVPEGQAVCLADQIGEQLPPEADQLLPLLDIYLSAGGTTTEVDGAGAAARADGFALELFNDNCGPTGDADPLGAAPAVVLNAASAQAAVASAAAPEEEPAPAPEAEAAPNLPKTGGGAALVGIGVLAVATGLRRR